MEGNGGFGGSLDHLPLPSGLESLDELGDPFSEFISDEFVDFAAVAAAFPAPAGAPWAAQPPAFAGAPAAAAAGAAPRVAQEQEDEGGDRAARRAPKRPRLFKKHHCQADGCHADLSALPFYNSRNHICREHARAASFLLGGAPSRFCQRCGLGHPVAAFDGARRSCRRALERYNSRRRAKAGGAGGGAGDGDGGDDDGGDDDGGDPSPLPPARRASLPPPSLSPEQQHQLQLMQQDHLLAAAAGPPPPQAQQQQQQFQQQFQQAPPPPQQQQFQQQQPPPQRPLQLYMVLAPPGTVFPPGSQVVSVHATPLAALPGAAGGPPLLLPLGPAAAGGTPAGAPALPPWGIDL